MRVDDWLALFRSHRDQKVFSIEHLKVLTEMEAHALRVALRRLTQRKVLQRICRGSYANPFNPPTIEEVSASLYQPSYISLESALSRHGILSQIPYTLTCVTTRLPRTFRTSLGMIQYHQVKKAYFFGFVKANGYFLAEPEKAVVDFVYLHRGQPMEGILSEWHWRQLNRRRLRAYAGRLHLHWPFS